eukprot:Hpha_TRINITY_DN26467_c0_g1::TRINITY_DN26467_c0_g1_i1::g.33874::m.33874/K13412/CPK; calcium-dependent protein kinase
MEEAPPSICERYLSLREGGYAVSATLGEGAYGVVRRCSKRGGEFAVKTMRRAHGRHGERVTAMVKGEVEVLQKVRGHNCVLRMEELLEEESAFHLVLELIAGEELIVRVADGAHGAWQESEALRLLCDVSSALAFVHGRGVIHRDVKPPNLMFSTKAPNAPLKLIDFGAAAVITPGERGPRDVVGTVRYMAPEVLRKEEYHYSVDVWSLGCIAFLLLTGADAFPHTGGMELRAAIAEGSVCWSHPNWPLVSADVRQLISSLLQHEPRQRPTAAEVEARLGVQLEQGAGGSLRHVREQAGQTIRSRALRRAVREVIQNNRRARSTERPAQATGSPRYTPLSGGEAEGDDVDDSPAFAAVVHIAQEMERRGEKLRSVFTRMDKNADGGVDAAELAAGLQQADFPVSLPAARSMIQEFDRNGDGRLQFNEFVRMLSACSQRMGDAHEVPSSTTSTGSAGGFARHGSGASARMPMQGSRRESAEASARVAVPGSRRESAGASARVAVQGSRPGSAGGSVAYAPAPAPAPPPATTAPRAPQSCGGEDGGGNPLQQYARSVLRSWPMVSTAFSHLTQGGKTISASQLVAGVAAAGGSISAAGAAALVEQFAPGSAALGRSAFTRLHAAAEEA